MMEDTAKAGARVMAGVAATEVTTMSPSIELSEDSSKPTTRRSGGRGGEGRGGDDGRHSDGSVTATKIKMPIVLVMSIIAMVVSVSSAWWNVSAHTGSSTKHLDEKEVIQGGGLAYKNELREWKWEMERKLLEEHKKMRRMLQGTTVSCRYKKGSLDSSCSLIVPDVE